MDGWPGFSGSIRRPPLPEPAPGMRPAGARGMGARADGAVRFSLGCPDSRRSGPDPGRGSRGLPYPGNMSWVTWRR